MTLKDTIKHFPRKKSMNLLLVSIWCLAILIGFVQLWQYSNLPGLVGEPPKNWPIETQLKVDPNKPTLIFFAHPRCSCTRASLAKLEKLLRFIQKKVTIHIVFYHPENLPKKWVVADLWETSVEMPIDSVVIDSGKKEINIFKPKTSGQVYLYSARGKLIFTGGITGGRGHEGDNAGRRAILSWVLDGKFTQASTFVYGCSLFHKYSISSIDNERSPSSPENHSDGGAYAEPY